MENSGLFVLPSDAYGGDTEISSLFVLRKCNEDIRQELRINPSDGSPPEFDYNKIVGKIAPMRTFDNIYGHFVNGITRIFQPTNLRSLNELIVEFKRRLAPSYSSKRLWDLDGVYTMKMSKMTRGKQYSKEFMRVVECQKNKPYLPFSVYPLKAHIESLDKRSVDTQTFKPPSLSTALPGIYSSLANNVNIEMGFEEKEGTYDLEQRTYSRHLLGFVCCAHTSHSIDAGKSRRLTSYTRIRVLSRTMLDCLLDIETEKDDNRDWVIYCMGLTVLVSTETVWGVVHTLNSVSKIYYDKQFIEIHKQSELSPATYMVYETEKILYISVSSGVVLRSTTVNSMIDHSMLYTQTENSMISHPDIPLAGPDSDKYTLSPFFLLVPFAKHDRPPRGLFASSQITQNVCKPWSIGTARIDPMYVSRPLVATELARRIEEDYEDKFEARWNIMSGHDLTVCYMNMPENYEDAIVVSSRFADNAGFSMMGLCTYRISESENIPEVGETLCRHTHRWWKMPCTSNCICKPKHLPRYTSTTAREPTAKVHQVTRTEDGHISIKVMSYVQILSGDKLTTSHGQKGAANIVAVEDLPIIQTVKTGRKFVADIYVSVGSIVSRQTSAQIFESAEGLRATDRGTVTTTDPTINTYSEEAYVIDAYDGSMIMRQLRKSHKVENMKVTIGITRIVNQTQTTRERHHLTHKPEGKYSMGTKSGRADGGGVKASEMDFHVMYSVGLIGCAEELLLRGNATVYPVCRKCGRIAQLHDCGTDEYLVPTRMVYNVAIADQISACVNGSSNVYSLEHI